MASALLSTEGRIGLLRRSSLPLRCSPYTSTAALLATTAEGRLGLLRGLSPPLRCSPYIKYGCASLDDLSPLARPIRALETLWQDSVWQATSRR